MTPQQIALVRESFSKLGAALDDPQIAGWDLGGILYVRLFEANPELRSLFPGNMDRQSRSLRAMLELIVKTLDLQENLVPLMRYLGERHTMFKIKPEHYRPFGEALIGTLELLLPDDFTSETRQAWEEAYRMMVEHMTRV